MIENKLATIQTRFEELERLLQDGSLIGDAKKIKEVSHEYENLKEIIRAKKDYGQAKADLAEVEKIIKENQDDAELLKISEEEKTSLEKKLIELENEIKILLVPQDPNDQKNAIVEIRAGAGGDEAALFAAELFRMYARYSEKNNWKAKIISQSDNGIGGFKEMIFEITGQNVYGAMRYESGVHRVQRVPETEKKGRVHTSTVTVAVLPEAEEVDLVINPNDLRIDTYCASGHGGQSVNTTKSAIRITHLPTGLIVTCQDEKSQHQNKEKALMVLRSRLLAAQEEAKSKEATQVRKAQIGTGDRSEKIRTYNFPQDRITDHRINENFNNISVVLDGQLDPIIGLLKERANEEKINS